MAHKMHRRQFLSNAVLASLAVTATAFHKPAKQLKLSFSTLGCPDWSFDEIIAFAQHQGFLRIELSVATINEKAIRLYKKAGFEQEGVFRKFSFLRSENRFLDEAVMSLLL